MAVEMKVPSPGESITEVQIARWIKNDGDYVEKDEEVCEIDSDKATLTLSAEASGILKILVKEGETIPVGSVVCSIDEKAAKPAAAESEPVPAGSTSKQPGSVPVGNSSKQPASAPVGSTSKQSAGSSKEEKVYSEGVAGPAAQKIMSERNITGDQVTATGKGGRITKADVMNLKSNAEANGNAPVSKQKPVERKSGERNQRREKMSMLRKKVSQRLVAVKQETAMLTTFNEVDMSAIMNIRKQYQK